MHPGSPPRDNEKPLSGWLSGYESELSGDPDFVAEQLALAITEEAARVMRERGISRSQLAVMMGVSRAYVTRIFNAPPNLTLRSIVQLATALGGQPEVSLFRLFSR